MIRRFSTTLQLADKEYLFLETSGYSTKNKAGWISLCLVFTRK